VHEASGRVRVGQQLRVAVLVLLLFNSSLCLEHLAELTAVLHELLQVAVAQLGVNLLGRAVVVTGAQGAGSLLHYAASLSLRLYAQSHSEEILLVCHLSTLRELGDAEALIQLVNVSTHIGTLLAEIGLEQRLLHRIIHILIG